MINLVVNKAAFVAALFFFFSLLVSSNLSLAETKGESQFIFHGLKVQCESGRGLVRIKASLASSGDADLKGNLSTFEVVTKTNSRIKYTIANHTQVSFSLGKEQFPISFIKKSNGNVRVSIAENCVLIEE